MQRILITFNRREPNSLSEKHGRGSDPERLHEAVDQRGRVGRRRETCKEALSPLGSADTCLCVFTLHQDQHTVPSSFQTCQRCKVRRKCSKKFSIQKFPEVLVLRILSSVWSNIESSINYKRTLSSSTPKYLNTYP